MFLHGGAWVGGDLSQYESGARAFTSKGVRVVLANYGLAPQFRHPAPIDDLQTVLRKLPANYSKIVLSGHSAGSHLIAFWNTAHVDSRVRGFIGLEGIYDIDKLIAVWPSYRSSFITAEFGADSKKWAAASPSLLPVKSKAPWLLIHSDRDELVDVAQTTDFEKHLRSSGVAVDSLRLKSESHFGAVEALSHSETEAFKACLKFIERVSK